jgi:methionyl aminopeptidase
MVTLKSPREIEIMARSGRIAAETLELVATLVRPGVTTEELDQAAERYIRAQGAKPSFKGLYGFPKSLCISVDEEIVHGIPSRKRVLREGSVVSVDVGVFLEGLHSDHARTFAVGAITEDAQRLLDVTERALHAGVEQARLGNHVGDITPSSHGRGRGFGVFGNWSGMGWGSGCTKTPGPELARPAGPAAGGHDPRHRADDLGGEHSDEDPRGSLDRRDRGPGSGGAFRAHRGRDPRGPADLTTPSSCAGWLSTRPSARRPAPYSGRYRHRRRVISAALKSTRFTSPRKQLCLVTQQRQPARQPLPQARPTPPGACRRTPREDQPSPPVTVRPVRSSRNWRTRKH